MLPMLEVNDSLKEEKPDLLRNAKRKVRVMWTYQILMTKNWVRNKEYIYNQGGCVMLLDRKELKAESTTARVEKGRQKYWK